MGCMVYIDEYRDAEGNCTLVARKSVPESPPGDNGLFPVCVFQLHENRTEIPVSKI